jgi:hypothetical protein
MSLQLADLAPGDVLSYWHDTGAFGAQLCYARDVKVGAKKVRVRGERGEESWKYPQLFNKKVPPKTVAELRAADVNI